MSQKYGQYHFIFEFKNYVKHVCTIYKDWKIGKIKRKKIIHCGTN